MAEQSKACRFCGQLTLVRVHDTASACENPTCRMVMHADGTSALHPDYCIVPGEGVRHKALVDRGYWPKAG